MSTLYSIFVVNNASGCNTEIEQQLNVTGCTTYIIRLAQNSNALGPFDVFYSLYPTPLSAATLVASAQTRTQMFNGVVISLGCVTPTPTPTPTVTPPPTTPTQTPTNTNTPSETPTNTPTPSNTPTFTPTPSNTPTFTPTESPTPTNTPTNTQTPTNTSTPTNTPTPTSTPVTFEIYIITQDGQQLLNQDGSLWISEQDVTSYFVTSGDTLCPSSPVTLTQTVYSPSPTWESVVRLFTDASFITPLNGGGLFYTNDSAGCGPCWQVDSDGYTSNYGSPC